MAAGRWADAVVGMTDLSVLDPALVTQVRRIAESRREELVAFCADLVAARSHLPDGNTAEAAAVVAGFLSAHGLAPELRANNPLKPNVVCRTGAGAPKLVVNGHLDTLSPGRLADWTVPVFALTRADGRLSGLGVGNMKAGTAALAVAFAALADWPEPLTGTIVYTAVADEVAFGPDGAAWLLDSDPDLTGDAVINAEGPGGLGVALAEKGLLWVELCATAPAGQGMLAAAGEGAIPRLACVIAEIDSWNNEFVTAPADLAGLADGGGEHGLRLSVNVGRIEGGDFVSQAATEARAEVDFRLPPGLTIAALLARIEASAAPHRVTVHVLKGWDPNWTPPDAAVVAAVTAAAQAVRGNARHVVRLPASDAARWRARGVPAVCFGPQAGLAAGVDDHVMEDDAVDCVAVYLLAALTYLRCSA